MNDRRTFLKTGLAATAALGTGRISGRVYRVKTLLAMVMLTGGLLPAGGAEITPATLLESGIIQGGTWTLREDSDKGTVLECSVSGAVPTDPVRHPANILWLPREVTPPFVFRMDARSLVPERKGADVCILLGNPEGTQLVYVHLSNDSDGRVHQVIMQVDLKAGKRHPIQKPDRPVASLAKGWNTFRVEVDRKGVLSVFADEDPDPVMSAVLPSLSLSRLGIGSFDDPAQFDQLKLE